MQNEIITINVRDEIHAYLEGKYAILELIPNAEDAALLAQMKLAIAFEGVEIFHLDINVNEIGLQETFLKLIYLLEEGHIPIFVSTLAEQNLWYKVIKENAILYPNTQVISMGTVKDRLGKAYKDFAFSGDVKGLAYDIYTMRNHINYHDDFKIVAMVNTESEDGRAFIELCKTREVFLVDELRTCITGAVFIWKPDEDLEEVVSYPFGLKYKKLLENVIEFCILPLFSETGLPAEYIDKFAEFREVLMKHSLAIPVGEEFFDKYRFTPTK